MQKRIKNMTQEEILQYCLNNLEDTVLAESWGEKGIYYNPGNLLKRGVYVLTVKERDGGNDKSSLLNRENIYRVNLGVRNSTFERLFGKKPKRPAAGEAVSMDYDFTKTNTLLPHPVYAWMGWICILNPEKSSFEKVKPYIKESYEYAKEKFEKRNINI